MIRYDVTTARSVVYLLQNTRTGDVKIGVTGYLTARISSLKSGAGAELILIRRIDGGRVTEKWMHRRFAHLRRSGEWFGFHDEMLSVVPPDELPVVQKITKRRDVRLTILEKLRLNEELAADIKVNSKSELLVFVSDLSDDQAGQVLSIIKNASGSVLDRKSEAA